MPRFLKILAIWITGISLTQAQLLESTAELPFLEKLFSTRDKPAFHLLLSKAKEDKLPNQTVFEAEFLFAIDTEDDAYLTQLLQRGENLAKDFSLDKSEIFASKDDFLATVEFIRAVKSFHSNDQKKFELHVKQAFWLSPKQAPLLASYIRKFKITNLKKTYQLPDDLTLTSLDNKVHSIKPLLKKHNGIILYLYNPWSREVMLDVENIAGFHQQCSKLGLYHIHHNIESSPEVTKDLEDYLNLMDKNNADLFTQSKKGDPLIQDLKIDSTPAIIFFNKEGNIEVYGSMEEVMPYLKAQ